MTTARPVGTPEAAFREASTITSGSMLALPDQGQMARFAPDFGRRALLTIDTEEEFDWTAPFRREGHGVTHIPALARFQGFCEELGIAPVYLIDWPIANHPEAIELLRDAAQRATAEIGIQLHPWVNPPFEEEVTEANSYAGNLPPVLEDAKFRALHDQIENVFGRPPAIYRAGRYGLGPSTAKLLGELGMRFDTSVRARFDYRDQQGPDYSRHPVEPYWSGNNGSVLELPLTTMYCGPLRGLATGSERLRKHLPTVFGVLSRLGLLERIPLTPEGITIDEAKRAIDVALEQGLELLVLSFHSPTLAPGKTPYTSTAADVESVYDWFTQIYDYLAHLGVLPTTIADIDAALVR